MDLDTGRWIPAGEVGPNEKTFTFPGLTPKKKYKFRVKAVNKEGESEPLEVEEAILAKNPYGKDVADVTDSSKLDNKNIINLIKYCYVIKQRA